MIKKRVISSILLCSAFMIMAFGNAFAAVYWDSGTDVAEVSSGYRKHVWSYYDNSNYAYHKSSVKMGTLEDISSWKPAGTTSRADIYQTKTSNSFSVGYAYYDYSN
jgi:hypothetical protein